MFRKLFAICAIACLACTFVACGGPGKISTDADVQQKKPQTDAKNLVTGGDKTEDDTVKQIVQ